MPFHIGLLIFPDITQLDMTGPYEVFIKFPERQVHLVWKTREAVTAVGGMQIMPTVIPGHAEGVSPESITPAQSINRND